MIKPLIELSNIEKYYLISAFQIKGYDFKEDFYLSRTFDYGRSFYVVFDGDEIGTVGIVTAEVKTRDEMFVFEIYNVDFEIVDDVIKLACETYDCNNINVGIAQRLALPDNYQFLFKSLSMKYIGEPRIEELDIIALDEDNASEFARIHNKTFLEIPNGATLDLTETLSLIEEGQGYIIYDKVAVGIIIIKGNFIDSIAILPEFQGQGYGRKALNKCIELIKDDVTLVVIDSNKPAMSLYESGGFIIERELKSWYKRI